MFCLQLIMNRITHRECSFSQNPIPIEPQFVSLQIRGVEIGIVVLVLMVWAGAIGLFFNRWGKIRMLLPYQPDYKQDQLKVPGTGVCATGACNGQHSHQVTPLMVIMNSLNCSLINHFAFKLTQQITLGND